MFFYFGVYTFFSFDIDFEALLLFYYYIKFSFIIVSSSLFLSYFISIDSLFSINFIALFSGNSYFCNKGSNYLFIF